MRIIYFDASFGVGNVVSLNLKFRQAISRFKKFTQIKVHDGDDDFGKKSERVEIKRVLISHTITLGIRKSKRVE